MVPALPIAEQKALITPRPIPRFLSSAASSTSVFPVITFKATTTAASQSTLVWLENQSTGQRLYFNIAINTGETLTIDLRFGRKTVTSDWRGLIYNQPLTASDFASWALLPGSNTIAAFVTGTVTGAVLLVHSQPKHWSVDMVAP